MMHRILQPWDAMRVMRGLFALIFLFAAATRHEPIAWFASAFFGLQALFNAGCCGVSGCATPRDGRMIKAPVENITYEEIP